MADDAYSESGQKKILAKENEETAKRNKDADQKMLENRNAPEVNLRDMLLFASAALGPPQVDTKDAFLYAIGIRKYPRERFDDILAPSSKA